MINSDPYKKFIKSQTKEKKEEIDYKKFLERKTTNQGEKK